MADKLLGARLKLKRANKHIFDLERLVRAFKKLGVCVIGVKPDRGQPNFNAVYFKSVRKVPDGIAAIAGDALFNLRSALDHVTMQLWIAAGNSPDDRTIQFPVFSKPRTALEYSARLGQVQRLGKEAVKAIKTIEPYNGGIGHGLFVLHELNNTDKHRLLLTVAVGHRPLNIGAMSNSALRRRGRPPAFTDFYSPFVTDPTKTLYRCERGSVIISVPKRSDHHKDVKLTFEVAFDEPHVGDGDSIVKTLQDLSKLVADVIDQLGRLL